MRVVPAEECFSSRGVPSCDNAAVINDGDPIAKALGFFDIVRREQNGLFVCASVPR